MSITSKKLKDHIESLKPPQGELNNDIGECFLLKNGFSGPIRYFSLRHKQFRVYYETEGYDCVIIISPSPGTIGNMTIQEQIERFSELNQLKNYHTGDWQVFINEVGKNHVATFRKEIEILNFMSICGCQLK